MLWSKGVYKEKTSDRELHSIYVISKLFRNEGVRLATYYVYILKSLKDKKFYTGCTADLKRRLKQHNNGMVRCTKARRPLKLVYWETFATRSEAMRRERQLKRIGKVRKKALVKRFRKQASADIY